MRELLFLLILLLPQLYPILTPITRYMDSILSHSSHLPSFTILLMLTYLHTRLQSDDADSSSDDSLDSQSQSDFQFDSPEHASSDDSEPASSQDEVHHYLP